MNLRQIEVFRAVMLTGSVVGASKMLHVSQPAISRLLAHAEQTAGIMLFERIKGRLHPTPEARQLLEEVENAYRSVQRVNSVVRDLALHRRGSLRIVSHFTLGGQLVPNAIAQFTAAHPEVRLSFECLRHSALQERLVSQQAELGVSLFPLDHPNLESFSLAAARLVCVVPQAHPLASKDKVTVRDLRVYPPIAYEPGTPFGTALDDLFSNQSAVYAPAEAGTPRDACALANAGVGPAVVDEFTALEFSGRVVVVKPLEQSSRLEAVVAYNATLPLSQAAHAFIVILRHLVGRPPTPRRKHAGSPRTS
jgi:DNA-binding transcriptional LysR family regulator